MNKSNMNSGYKNSIVSIIILVLVAFLFIAIFIQGVKVEQKDDMFKVSGGLFYSEKIAYSDITNVELRDNIEYGSRTNGASLLKYKLGIFSNKEFGKYKLFVNDSINKFIIVTYGEKVLVFNYKDLSETTELYSTLLEKSGLKK